jgi:DNA-directed RNA polymerase specialized sigma24 family protein
VQETELDEADDFSLYRTIAVEDPFPYSDSLHLDFLHQFGREDVRAVLAELPELYRLPLVLCYCEGYQVKEVAYMLEVPLGTMLARVQESTPSSQPSSPDPAAALSRSTSSPTCSSERVRPRPKSA